MGLVVRTHMKIGGNSIVEYLILDLNARQTKLLRVSRR